MILLWIITIFQACSEKEKDCNVACTEEFRTIVVQVKDSEGQPVALDDFKVVVIESGKDITLKPSEAEFQLMREKGNYPIFSDQYVQEYKGEELEIEFQGFIEGETVVSANYKVGADCCHVYLISGDTELVLPNSN